MKNLPTYLRSIMLPSRINSPSISNHAFIAPRSLPPTSPGLAETSQVAGFSSEIGTRRRRDHVGNPTGVLLRQYITSIGEVHDLDPSFSGQGGNPPFLTSGSSQRALIVKSDGYKLDQKAYVAKMRRMLTPRALSESLKEFDSTKDNPPNSQSARFGIKPEPDVYKYRLVSWGEAGSGIPLMNNPYSVRPQNTPPVHEGFKRKKFTTDQREAVRSASYKKVVQDNLNAGLHNSHGLASRFLGPETSANIAPATFTNHKNKNWGQGEMQSHLEHALFRIEDKAKKNGFPIFLRYTDYLGKFGELQSRKIKVFLSEPVKDEDILSEKGTVKETTLGTFYLPGMINEPENGDLIQEFKDQIERLEIAIRQVTSESPGNFSSRPQFEMRYRYGICAQDLKPVSEQKLIHGKIHRSNDGLNPILQRTPSKKALYSRTQKSEENNSSSMRGIRSEVFERINETNENPRVLKGGEEVWQMDEVESVLSHIRHPNLDDHIQGQIDSGQLSLSEATDFHTLGLSHSSSESSISTQDTSSDEEKTSGRTVELEFDQTLDDEVQDPVLSR